MPGSIGEPEFHDHRKTSADAFMNALGELSEVRAYTLSADELEEFKEAHLALRDLAANFEPYATEDA